MRLPVALSTLLILAGCGGNPQPAGSPPAPVSAEAAPAPTPGPPSQATPGGMDSSATVASADSLRAAVDSALDAAILAELEAGPPAELKPSAAPPTEDEAAVLRNLFDIDVANYADHERVRYYLDFFTTRGRERMGIWLNRMGQWEPMIRSQLILRGLPGDLAYLPLIESGYSNTAVSRSKAVGMWQFMRGTARFYGLRVDRWVDERREPFRATSTAIRYLSDLTTRFGSPYLAAAAYNGGPGRVQRGLQRLDIPVGDDEDEEEDLESAPDGAAADETTPPDARDAAFFTLADSRYLRRETKDYVPKLIAAAMIAKRPEKYGFRVTPREVLRVDSVTVPGATGLDVVARVSGGSLTVLRELNPHLLRSVTPPGRKSVVLVPAGTGPETERAILALPASERVSALAHRVRAGETTTRIARRYGLTVAELRDFNPALLRRGPRVGETLRIPGLSRVKSLAAADERVARASSAARGTHRVRRGENLGLIARKYRLTVKQLQLWNGLGSSTQIRAGQVLRLRPRPAGNVRVAK